MGVSMRESLGPPMRLFCLAVIVTEVLGEVEMRGGLVIWSSARFPGHGDENWRDRPKIEVAQVAELVGSRG